MHCLGEYVKHLVNLWWDLLHRCIELHMDEVLIWIISFATFFSINDMDYKLWYSKLLILCSSFDWVMILYCNWILHGRCSLYSMIHLSAWGWCCGCILWGSFMALSIHFMGAHEKNVLNWIVLDAHFLPKAKFSIHVSLIPCFSLPWYFLVALYAMNWKVNAMTSLIWSNAWESSFKVKCCVHFK